MGYIESSSLLQTFSWLRTMALRRNQKMNETETKWNNEKKPKKMTKIRRNERKEREYEETKEKDESTKKRKKKGRN